MPFRRLPLALALAAAAAAALPGAASAQARRPAGSVSSSGMLVGGLIGFEDWGGDSGLTLRGDLEMPIQHLSPQIRMSFVGSLGYSHWSYNAGFFQTPSSTLWILKATPALRFSFGNHPMIRPYADGGIGLHYASYSIKARDVFGNQYSFSESDTSLHLRFAGGVLFQITPTVALGGELDLTPYFGKVGDNTWSLMFAAVFRV